MMQHIAIAAAAFFLQDAMPPPGPVALQSFTYVGGVVSQTDHSAVVDEITRDFNTASNRALLYVGAPAADPAVLREMRRRYTAALASVQQLDRGQHADYDKARDSVKQLREYVEKHPPGILVPPVVSPSD